ncbi:casein kinase 1, epsilon, partial [Coniochaeta sp. 2T2.1]
GVEYKIGKKIGEGSFGIVYEGRMLSEGNWVPVAFKFEKRNPSCPQLRDDFRKYTILKGCPGIPSAYYFGEYHLHNILIMDLLGPSLEVLFTKGGRKFSLKTVVSLARQMLCIVKNVHEKALIYCDIKPDNFLIGRQSSECA